VGLRQLVYRGCCVYCRQATQPWGVERYCRCSVYRQINIVVQSNIDVVLYASYSTVWCRTILLLCCIQATQQCGVELYWAYTVYRLLSLSCIITSTANVLFQRTPLLPTVFRRVRKIAIIGCLLCHACLSVRPSAWNNSGPQDRFSLD